MIVDTPAPLVRSMKDLNEGIRTGHAVICGITRYGKTTAALHFFLNDALFDQRKKPTHIFIDTKHDDALLPHGVLVESIDDFRFHLGMNPKRIIYRPPGTYERGQHLTDLINVLFEYRAWGSCPYAVFIDEVHLFISKSGRHEGLERLSTTGAGKNIHAIVIGQRLQDIHEQTLSQCLTRVAFYMQVRPEYLRSRNMVELTAWMPWLKKNPYYFAYQTGVDWKLHVPVPLPMDLYSSKFAPPG